MDIATIIGFILINGLVFSAMGMSSVGIGGYIDIPSMLITVGGTFGAVFVSFPLDSVKNLVAIVKNVFIVKLESPVDIINTIVQLAEKARKEGLLALESDINNLSNEFMKQGLQLAVDGTEGELLRDILTTEIEFIEDRHKKAASVLETIASLGPAFGMIGTLVGLIAMLAGMDDPSTIGPNMSVALITTLYGSMMANMFSIPIANKLKYYSAYEIMIKTLILEGIISLQAGDNPRIIKTKLLSFLDSKTKQIIGTD